MWENFLSFPEYELIFLNIHWSLLGMSSKLQFTCSEEHFEKGSGLWGKVFKLSLKYIRHGCQNYSLRVQRSTLRKVIFFWGFFKIVFGLWSIMVRTSGENVQQCCQMCILCVRGTFLFFFVNGSHVLFNFGLKLKTYWVWKKVSSFLLKLQFKCPGNFLRSFYQEHVCFSI